MIFFHKELKQLFEMSQRTYDRRIKYLKDQKIIEETKPGIDLNEKLARTIAQHLCFEDKFNKYVKLKSSKQ